MIHMSYLNAGEIPPKTEAGKCWVDEVLQSLVDEVLQSFTGKYSITKEWIYNSERLSYSLVLSIREVDNSSILDRKVIKFFRRELDNCPNPDNKSAQNSIKKKI